MDVSVAEATAAEEGAIDYDAWCWVLREVRRALELINERGQLTMTQEARETVEAAMELLQEL